MTEDIRRQRPPIINKKPIGKASRPKAAKPSLYEQVDIPRKAAIYVRVSTLEQAQGYSTDAQERICRDYILRQKPNWDIADIFRDEGYSGKTDKRPGFQSMLEAVEEGNVTAIICHHLDRFSRNLHDIMVYFKRLEDQCVYLSFAEEQFDFSTPEGRMHFNILAVFADWYLKNLSRETKKGKASVVLTGRQNNQLPFGYSKDDNGNTLIVPGEAAIIQESFEKYATGNYTDQKLADNLNERGFATRQGRAWSKEGVRTMLTLDFHYGVVKYLDDLYQGSHDPIVSQDLFEQVQVIRKAHAVRPRTFSRRLRVYLLNGLIRCAACGRNLRAQGAQNNHRYYREVSHMRGFPCPDERTSITADKIESQIGEIVETFQLPEDWQQEILASIDSGDENQGIEIERKSVEEKLKRLGELYLDNMLNRASYLEQRDRLKRQLSILVVPEPQVLLETGRRIESFRQIWPLADYEQKREICRMLFEWVEVDMRQRMATRVSPRREFVRFFDQNPHLKRDDETGDYVIVGLSTCLQRKNSEDT
jgi:DNA invertase Pin-like site-specific DNA recombinase